MLSLETLLTHQQQYLQDLLALLVDEHQSLAKRDVDAIHQVATDKNALLQKLIKTDQLLAAHPQRESLKTDPALNKKRQQLEQLLNDCHQANAINGRIIEASSAEIERLAHDLNKLLQQQSMTYDKLGKRHSASHHGKSFKV
ncbi:flagella synthesis protein FlgN [Celerinatantimonas sp. YJH-8]|uniref:flagella synthesis protein FlgN n=1 Tax=Celerinatantimonas sp. YJH-8 TaxID=3228714 RepID=UPI0038BFEBB5